MRFIITALLYLGFGTIAFAQDHTPLFNKISKMANEGNIEASFHLGMLYTNGIGTETNIAEGVKWLEKAHNNNEAMASYELGRYYEGQVDETVEVNVEKSFRSKMTAANMGHSLAQFEIGMMYLNFRNATQAEKFLIKAAKQGPSKYTSDQTLRYHTKTFGKQTATTPKPVISFLLSPFGPRIDQGRQGSPVRCDPFNWCQLLSKRMVQSRPKLTPQVGRLETG